MSKGKYMKAVNSHVIFLKSFPKSYSCVTIKWSTMCRNKLSDSGGEQAWASGRETIKSLFHLVGVFVGAEVLQRSLALSTFKITPNKGDRSDLVQGLIL